MLDETISLARVYRTRQFHQRVSIGHDWFISWCLSDETVSLARLENALCFRSMECIASQDIWSVTLEYTASRDIWILILEYIASEEILPEVNWLVLGSKLPGIREGLYLRLIDV